MVFIDLTMYYLDKTLIWSSGMTQLEKSQKVFWYADQVIKSLVRYQYL